MKNSIKKAIGLLFETFPFSKENEEQREKILSLAYQKYERGLSDGVCPAEAAENSISFFFSHCCDGKFRYKLFFGHFHTKLLIFCCLIGRLERVTVPDDKEKKAYFGGISII